MNSYHFYRSFLSDLLYLHGSGQFGLGDSSSGSRENGYASKTGHDTVQSCTMEFGKNSEV